MDVCAAIQSIQQDLTSNKYKEAADLLTGIILELVSPDVDKNAIREEDLLKLARLLRVWAGREDDGSSSYEDAEQALKECANANIGDAIDKAPFALAQLVLDKVGQWFSSLVNPSWMIEQAWLHFDNYRNDKALRLFEMALILISTSDIQLKFEALRGKAASLIRLAKFREANEVLNEAAATGGVTPAVRLERGWLYFEQGSYELALKEFAAVIGSELEPHDLAMARAGLLMARQIIDTAAIGEDRSAALIQEWMRAPMKLTTTYVLGLLIKCIDFHSKRNRYQPGLLACNTVLELDSSKSRLVAHAYEGKIEALTYLRRYDEARQVFRESQRKFPTNLDLWMRMGYCLHWQRRFAESLRFFDGSAIQEEPDLSEPDRANLTRTLADDDRAAEWSVVSLRNLRRLDEAETTVDQALSKFGERSGLLTERGVVYYAKADYKLAIEAFDRALKIGEYDAFAIQWRLASIRKSATLNQPELLDKALAGIREATDRLPNEAGLWEEYGWISFERKEIETAERCFYKAIELDPYYPRRYFSRVEMLTRLNRNDDAQAVFSELLKKFPNDRQVIEQHGWFNLRQGNLEDARKQFNSIINGSPANRWLAQRDAPGVNGLGGYYLERLEYSKAEFQFCRAVEAVENEPQYKINLALSLVQQVKEPGELPKRKSDAREKLLKKAADLCHKALALDPQNGKAYICLGVIAFKRCRYLESETHFRKATELSPAEGGWVELGSLYVQMGNYDKALESLRLALEFNQNDPRAHLELGNLLLLTNRNEEAIRECRQAASIDRTNHEGYRALGIALMSAGAYDEAEKTLRDAMMYLRPNREWQLRLALAHILIQLGDNSDKDHDRYNEALKQIVQAERSVQGKSADVLFHAGVAQFKLEDYPSSRKSFVACVKANRDRFDAERYVRLLNSVIRQEKAIAKNNFWGGWVLTAFCVIALSFVWFVHIRGWRVPAISQNGVAAAAGSTETKATATQAEASPAKVPDMPVLSLATERPGAATAPSAREDLVVDKTILTVVTPILLGLMVIGLLLPNLNKIKLPGGIEAEVIEHKPNAISSGPKLEIGFGSSLPTISPGPR
jgi:tetratricopeptide (TPR) repeat protein